MKCFCLFLYCFFLFPEATAQDNEELRSEFIYKENLIIGDDQSADLEYTFGLPSAVISDSNGTIYISDDKYGSIRVFDHEGVLISEFGGPGRGPGEFSAVNSMTILPNGDLIIYDLTQFRFTRFKSNGEVVDTYLAPENFTMHPDYMRALGDGRVIFYAKDYAARYNKEPSEDFLIHVLSYNNKEVTNQFVPITHTINVSDEFEYRIEGGNYRGVFTNTDTTLTLAPFFYRGKIFEYKRNIAADDWSISDTMYSYVGMEKPYKRYDDYRDVIGIGISASSPNGPLAGIMNNESLGLFRKKDGSLLHLALIRINGKQQLYASQFNKDGELLAHGQVTNLKPGLQVDGYYRRMRFYWMDEKDQIYILDQPKEGFTVRRGFIEVKE